MSDLSSATPAREPADSSVPVEADAPAAPGAPAPPDTADASAVSRARSLLHRASSPEVLAGLILLGATVAALLLANSPARHGYEALRDTVVGPASLGLDLTVGQWAADGLLAVFFFVVGLELKEEFVHGRLRSFRSAAVPVAAGLGGVAVPAAVFLLVNVGGPAEVLRGWAIPSATDIAFALAVFAVFAPRLPGSLRIFLLTLAVIDDLVAITIIATVYTDDLHPLLLLAAVVPVALFALLVRVGLTWWVLLPIAVVAWALVHASGVHATVAGVVLALTVPAGTLTHRFAALASPFSTYVAVPLFAFFSAGVTVGGAAGFREALTDPVTLGIIAGLVVGKPVGVLGTVLLVTRVPALGRTHTIRWADLVGVAFLAGIGFTVALLVGELSFGVGTVADDHVKVGVLTGSALSALLGAAVLAMRAASHRRRSQR